MPAPPKSTVRPKKFNNSTKPTEHFHSLATSPSIVAFGLHHSQERLRNASSKLNDRFADVRRSYDMISRQVRRSTAARIVSIVKSKEQRKEENKQAKFMHNFEEISNNLIPTRQSQDNSLTQRKKTIKLTKFITEVLPTDQSTFSQRNQDQLGKQQSDGYYSRLRKRLKQQIEGLTDVVCNRVTEDLQINGNKKSDVKVVLGQKKRVKKSETWVRVSRTGLVMPPSDFERKARGTNLAMIENYKAKKDFNFQKCLSKNCAIVLQQLARHEATLQRPVGRKKRNRGSEPRDGIIRQTQCSQRRQEIRTRRSADGIGILKWRERCLQIQRRCWRGLEKSSTQAGLRVLSKYSRRLHRQLDADQTALTSLLHHNPVLLMEEYSKSIPNTFFQK